MRVRTEYGELALKQTNAPQIVEANSDVGSLLRARSTHALIGRPAFDRRGAVVGEVVDVVVRADDDGHALLAVIALDRLPPGPGVARAGYLTVSFEELMETEKGVVVSAVTALAQRAA